MNIEQAIDILENSIADYVIGEYCEKCADNKICDDRNEDCYFQQAIDIIITAYEKEKEKNKEAKEKLEKHIKFCEQEASGSLNNEICKISLSFDKNLLDIINGGNKQ